MKFNDLLTGFIRLHILHHAAEQEIYGQWMIDELAHHGYRLSPGTLYPMLHAMERNGYLTSRVQREGASGESSTRRPNWANRGSRWPRSGFGNLPAKR